VGLTDDLADFHSHPMNVGLLRRRLRIRISVGRVTKEVHRLLPGRAPDTFYDSAKPFGEEAPDNSQQTDRPPHSASN
jgi:hypothetical protein